MKALFWILLLVNILFFAVMHWGRSLVSDEPVVQIQPPLHEEKIRLLSTPPVAPTPPATAPIAALPASTPANIPANTPVAAAVPVAPPAPFVPSPNTLSCMEWGDFSGADLERSTAALSALQLGDKLSQRQIEHSVGYWVYIPPLKDKAAVNQKIAQLKVRGIEEYFVVQDKGPWLNAISLGIFKTPETAQHFLDSLRTKDVRSARTGERNNKFNTTLFVLNELDTATVAKLTEIQKDFPGSSLKNIPCTH